MSENTRGQALVFARHGWPVFPCHPGGKEPAIPSAHPHGDPARGVCAGECGRDGHGFRDAATDPDKITWWWRRMPDANLGIATGAPGPDVLDIDQHGKAGSGFAGFNQLQRWGLVPEPTAIVQTPSGGLHLYFRGTSQRNGAIARAHIDYRGAGGYVVAPPSTVGGRPYEVISHQPVSNEFDWLAARNVLDPAQAAPKRELWNAAAQPAEIDHLAGFVQRQEHGNRNRGLFWAACRAAEHGVLDTDGIEALVDAAVRSGLRGGEAEARKTIASALRSAQPSFDAGDSREAAS
jgi:Bifunctional DNA primase/polymerase, N-terminal